MIEVNGPPIVVDVSKTPRTLLTDFDEMFLNPLVPERDQRERLLLASFPLASLSFGPSVEGDFDALRDRPRDPEAHLLLASSQDIP